MPSATGSGEKAPESRPRLYVVALAHLDTQWRWTVRDTAREYLPRTVHDNEALFARFPRYVLSFEGAHRYRLLAECHPELLQQVRQRVAEGRWFPAGAAWEAFDANLPAPESLLRQILLGRIELERTVGLASDDLFLPDCFGFPRALATVAAHCGILGFSTQKLRRGAEMRAAFGIPFPLGRWRGPDGGELLAALDPGEYGAQTRADLACDPEWISRFARQTAQGLPAALLTYQGLGDKGGAIDAETAAWLERAADSDGPIRVLVGPSQQLFSDLTAEERARLPVHDGDLLLRLHATGCYTSRSQLKAWHRKAESLAAAAERAVALASPLTGADELSASGAALRTAWERVLSHEMHDDLTGTSLPEAYRYSAAGLGGALNLFAEELEAAMERLAGELDTDTEGEPLLVYNPLGRARDELVEIERFDVAEGAPPPRVFGPDGNEVASQWRRLSGRWSGCFRANVPALSISVFELRESTVVLGPEPATATATSLEHDSYRIEIDAEGDLASCIDKRSGLELLSAPAGIELLENRSERFPSWEIRYEDLMQPAAARVDGPVVFERLESGPLRTRLRVRQESAGSGWRRDYILAAGGPGSSGEIVEIDFGVDWRTDGTLAKASFPFAWEFRDARYDLGVGVADRAVSTEQLYEVPAQNWAAAPRDEGGGALLLSDAKQGWDHPDLSRLRLSLLHTPRIGRRFRYQRRQDFGRHRFRIGLVALQPGDGLDRCAALGERFRQPLLAFRTRRSGGRGRIWTPLSLSDPALLVMALKPAEAGRDLVLRLRESSGTGRAVAMGLADSLRFGARLDGQERVLAGNESQTTSAPMPPMAPFELRTMRLEIVSPPSAKDGGEDSRPVAIERSVYAVAGIGERSRDGGVDGRGTRIPRHLVPQTLWARGLRHDLAARRGASEPTAARAAGQQLAVPSGFRRLALILGSFGRETVSRLVVGSREVDFRLPDSLAPLGRFDELARAGPLLRRTAVRQGFLSRFPVRWIVPHLLDRRGRIEHCRSAILFGLELEVLPGEERIVLPRHPSLLLFAAAFGRGEAPAASALAPLFEDYFDDTI